MKYFISAVAITSVLTIIGCSKAKETADSASNQAEASFAQAFPTGISISAFPETNSISTSAESTEYDPNDKSVGQKKTEQQALIAGTATSCFSPELFFNLRNYAQSNCYAPDSDIAAGTGTDATSGEACLVTFARSQIANASGIVDQSLNLIAATLCQAGKDSSFALPSATNASVDLKSHITAGISANTQIANAPTVSSATVTRLANNSAGKAEFRYDISFVNSAEETRTIHLVSSEGTQTGSYNGVLWVLRENTQGSNGKNHAISVTFAKTVGTSETRLIFKLREANIRTSITDPFTSAGEVDYNAGAVFNSSDVGNSNYGNYDGFSNSNDVIEGMRYLEFNVNAASNAGSFGFWVNPGGSYYENARGMVFEIAAATDGKLSGCAVSGAANSNPSAGQGISIRRSVKESEITLLPRGYYHPQGSPQTDTKIYKQCFAQNTAGKYVIDNAKITDTANGYDIIDVSSNTVTPPDTSSATAASGNIKPTKQ